MIGALVAVFVGGAAAYLGSLMLTKRMALVGDALGHVALPGMGVALLLGIDPSWGALFSLAVGILVIWMLAERTALSLETLVGIVFVSSLALGFLIVPQPELLESLIGDISALTLPRAVVSIGVSLLTLEVTRRIYPAMMLLNLSQDLAAVRGIRARKVNLVYLSVIAILVSVGVRITGSLLVGALVIIPPASARVLSTHLGQYARTSAAIGAFSSLIGIFIAIFAHFPAGPAIILVNVAIFVISILIWQIPKAFSSSKTRRPS